MIFNTSLVIEYISKGNIFICTKNGEIPYCEIDKCPRQCAADLLERITDIKVNPYVHDWITIELTDVIYEKDFETVYIIYVCRIAEKVELKEECVWSDYSTVKSKLEKIKSLI